MVDSNVQEKHKGKKCPRCGRSFVCKSNRIEHCECVTVPLTPDTVQYIQEHYDDCLCVTCLWELHYGT